MSFGDVFRVKKICAELEATKKELTAAKHDYDELSAFLTPELSELKDVKDRIRQTREEYKDQENSSELVIAGLNDTISANRDTIRLQQDELKKIRSEILVAKENVELESFALYEPKFSFVTADEYADKLKAIREEQKVMLKNNKAAIGVQSWTVNGSETQGNKLVKDMMKLCVRSFNNECDVAVAAVKFNNFDRCVARIEKSAEAIQKLGSIMSVSISHKYKQLKITELRLALEYQTKKQDEKEKLKELRAQEREAVKLAKEIEEARKASYKEQQHYSNALQALEKQIQVCDDPDALADLKQKCDGIKQQLASIDEELKQIDYREANQKAGYVYVISNIGSFGKNVYKIGMTRRLEPLDRIDELGDASVPFNFDVHALVFSDNAPALEAALHQAFADKKLNMVNQRREFFNVSLDEIKRVITEHHDKTVEFTETPVAEQYRESLKLRGV